MTVKTVPLSQVLEFIRGITFKPDDKVEPYSEGSVVCMRTKNIQTTLDDSDVLAVPEEFIKRGEQYLEEGDLLISSANSWELVGKTVRVPALDHKCTAGGFISILRPLREQIDPDYLFRFIMHKETQHKIRHLGRQTTNISNLDRKRFLKLEIPLPPLEIQKQIAAVLEKADNLRGQCQQMEQELNTLAQSVFLDMFGDGFNSIELGSQLSVVTSGSRGWAKYYSEHGARFIRSLDVQMNYIGSKDIAYVNAPKGKESERAKVQHGDVLLTITGSRIGRVCWVTPDINEAYISQHVALLRLKEKFLPEFVSYFLSMPDLGQRQIQKAQYGQTKPGLNLAQIKAFSIPEVSLNKQKEFLKAINKNNEIRKFNGLYETHIGSLFNSLMQRAFKGELKLKDVA